MAINIMPPSISALDLKDRPHRFPILTPIKDKIKVVMPMIAIAGKIFTCRKAKVIPTANASILVAIDRISRFPRVKAGVRSVLQLLDSFIIFIPIMVSNIKAIQ